MARFSLRGICYSIGGTLAFVGIVGLVSQLFNCHLSYRGMYLDLSVSLGILGAGAVILGLTWLVLWLVSRSRNQKRSQEEE